jgi:hypothetical protein
MNESEQERRGICCHEAGHAVVLHALEVPVRAIFIKFTDAKGWHGCAKSDPANDRPVSDRLVFFAAGRMAEEHFSCRAHDQASIRDYGEIDTLLDRECMLQGDREQHIAEAEARAGAILRRNHDATLRVIDWLVEHGSIDGNAFECLMQRGS